MYTRNVIEHFSCLEGGWYGDPTM